MFQQLVSLLLITTVFSFPQQTSYLAPLADEEVAASEAVNSYGAPQGDILGEASEPVSLYSSPSESVSDYSLPEAGIITNQASSNSFESFVEPKTEIIFTTNEVANDYSSPQAEVISSSSRTSSDYSSPRASVISSPTTSFKSFSSSSNFVQGNSLSSYGSNDKDVASSNLATVAVRAEPVAIVRSEFTGPNEGNYHYAYETANGIKQDVTGEMKVINNEQVYTMSGSYEYIGADGLTYVVDWYADETGYHPSAPHLPKSVEPITDAVREAVAAQLRAAAEEDAAAAASANTVVFASPENVLDDVYGLSDSLAGYGETASATELLDSYSLPSYN